MQEKETSYDVKEACKALGITQNELATKLGLTNIAVSKWSTRKSVPLSAQKSIAMLFRIKELEKDLAVVKEFFALKDKI